MRGRNQALAGLGALLMVIDHIGAVFFPTVIAFRLLGRLSFPIFAFGIAQGVIHTASFKKYFCRLLLAAVVSQPIYWLTLGQVGGNPLFALLLGALVLWLWRQEGIWRGVGVAILISAVWLNISYGWYGVATIFFYGFYEQRRSLCYYAQMLLQLAYGVTTTAWIQVLSLLAFPLMGRSWQREIHLPRYFFYFFYPVHLLLLLGVRALL